MQGDELEPAWSSDGRDLIYVHQQDNVWTIMLRRFGMPETALITSSHPITAPQWRPDGSLITYRQEHESGSTIEMIILSAPLLVRPLVSGEDFGSAPVSWLDRQQLFYTANGGIRRRNFNSWSSVNVPFRATLLPPEEDVVEQPQRQLSSFDLPNGQLVIRAARLFDGIGGGYRENLDVVLDGGKIVALEPRQDRPGQVIVDLGAVTVLPGLIDSYSALPQDFDDSYGALLLSFGVTTIVADYPLAAELDQRWSGKSTPGPRIFNSGSEELVASLLHGTSSVADANTPGLGELLRVRQSSLLPAIVPRRRFSEPPDLEGKGDQRSRGQQAERITPRNGATRRVPGALRRRPEWRAGVTQRRRKCSDLSQFRPAAWPYSARQSS